MGSLPEAYLPELQSLDSHRTQLHCLHLFLGCQHGGAGEGVFLVMRPFSTCRDLTFLFIFSKVIAQKQNN